MLQFFRKYQKIFFIFITIVVVVTFVFFGTYQAVFGPKERAQEEALNGEDAKLSYLVSFLSNEDPFGFNEAIVSKNFLETGFASHLFQKYLNENKSAFLERCTKEMHYLPYKHPEFADITAMSIWHQFAPEVEKNLLALQKIQREDCDDTHLLELFNYQSALYLAEKQFPPDLLAYILRLKLQQKEIDLQKDSAINPRLYQRKGLALFGYRDLVDWFGADFIKQIAKAIREGAMQARQMGYTVSQNEIRGDLFEKCGALFQEMNKENKGEFSSSLELYRALVQRQYFNEEMLLGALQEVYLFERLFNDVGQIPFLDHKALRNQHKEASDYALIEVTKIPNDLRLNSIEDLKSLEAYLWAVSGEREDALAFPHAFDELELIEKRAPQLIAQTFVIEQCMVSKKQLASKVSVKKTWEWELEPKNWKRLIGMLEEIGQHECKEGTIEEQLASLPEGKRHFIDSCARSLIVEEHPEWLEEAFAATPFVESKLEFVGSKCPIEGIVDGKALKLALEECGTLKNYTQDNEHYFAFRVINPVAQKRVVTFAEAKEEKLLDHQVDVDKIKIALGDRPLNARLESYISEVQKGVTFAEWLPKKEEKKIHRNELDSEFNFNEIAGMEKGATSQVFVSETKGPYFYKMLGNFSEECIPTDKLIHAQNPVVAELKLALFKKILNNPCGTQS